ncbi:methyltransferase domain-containing protein [Candidatus Fermentibacteria bacterium]|nr:methyltransferase domain-containing protein [Candidatus Fermentibacteria bacterium]
MIPEHSWRSDLSYEGYAEPKLVERLEDCFFYHTMDLPGLGTVEGCWDLRTGAREYLGNVEFAGMRVLDIGTANGFLAFHMESRGAEVTGYDLSPAQDWDTVPYAGRDSSIEEEQRREQIGRMNNAFWLAHRLLRSRVRLAQGAVYDMPPSLGSFDICVFGSILLHLRDPFLAMQRGLALTSSTAIVTDMLPRSYLVPRLGAMRMLPGRLRRPAMRFSPDFRACSPTDTWWKLYPETVEEFLGVLGFEDTRLSFHRQLFRGRNLPLFTIVAKRTKGRPYKS